MSEETMLELLKIDLGISATAYDDRLRQYMKSAKANIEREGVALSDASPVDCDLIVRYAAHMWRKRDSGEGIPRMLRWEINNRLFEKKEQADG